MVSVICGGGYKCENHHDRGRDAAESRCHDPPSRVVDVVETAHREGQARNDNSE